MEPMVHIHIVTNIPVLAITEDTALSLGLCEAGDLIRSLMTCMLILV